MFINNLVHYTFERRAFQVYTAPTLKLVHENGSNHKTKHHSTLVLQKNNTTEGRLTESVVLHAVLYRG
ncbi:MAG: hypothetical protein RRY38_00115, partial [Oscillospiraceae bacterium]